MSDKQWDISWAAEPHNLVVNFNDAPVSALSIEARIGQDYATEGENDDGELHLVAVVDYIDTIILDCPVSVIYDKRRFDSYPKRPGSLHHLELWMDGHLMQVKIDGAVIHAHSVKVHSDPTIGTMIYLHYRDDPEQGTNEREMALLRLPDENARYYEK